MGAGQSTPSSSPPTPSSQQLSTPSPPSSSSTSSPFSLPSPESSPSKLCEFSEKQVEDFKKEIESLKMSDGELEQLIKSNRNIVFNKESDFDSKMFHFNTASFETKEAYLKDPNTHLLIKHRAFCLMLTDIFLKYKKILEKINALCIRCKTDEAVNNVDDEINDIIGGEDLIQAYSWLNSFKQFYFLKEDNSRDEYINSLKVKFDKLEEMNKMFENVDEIKSQMMDICLKRQISQQERSVAFTAKGFGGKSSRTRSKKRKQMKMKMKSSNYRSKTRNSKKKYNGKSVKK
jgi:hypothetical protein